MDRWIVTTIIIVLCFLTLTPYWQLPHRPCSTMVCSCSYVVAAPVVVPPSCYRISQSCPCTRHLALYIVLLEL
ncbi:hypothetical protein EV363DRAFT_1353449 [Boletus edulis]|uniref:Uncharacterized protein n=1 Tax=Boletus edulis BED1 TaxID=1328754 RepID=A0AAD4BWJ1_BOLED|nr:hypothetical protein EV363DRAFT_1353449 [Boletus edulis]KAF8442051.1 hypothetical protein L210DRAFT_3535663 [Boletus edulis BED1]